MPPPIIPFLYTALVGSSLAFNYPVTEHGISVRNLDLRSISRAVSLVAWARWLDPRRYLASSRPKRRHKSRRDKARAREREREREESRTGNVN